MEVGQTAAYGRVKIKLIKKNVFANFVIRKLRVFTQILELDKAVLTTVITPVEVVHTSL